jgi:parallel beta-helix repeat protein
MSIARIASSGPRKPAARSAVLFALAIVLAAAEGCSQQPGGGAAKVTVIEAGPDVQKRAQLAMIQAKPGETIEFAAGKFDFKMTLSLDVEGVTIRGKGVDQTILSFKNQGQGTGGEGLLVTSGRFLLEDLTVEDAKGDAIKVNNVQGVTFRRVRTRWTAGPQTTNGSYGLYPVMCRDVLIEDCLASEASDAGIYVGQSENIIVRRNKLERNVAGIEIENSIGADVYDNEAIGNSGGILVFTLPELPRKIGTKCRVFNNRIVANNEPNFAAKGNVVALVPQGTGMIILANHQTEVFNNKFEKNQTVNLAIASFNVTQRPYKDPQYDPYPDGIYLHDNTFIGGGEKPSGEMGVAFAAMLRGRVPDIIVVGATDKSKLVDGKLPPELQLRMRDNGDADFANIDVEQFGLMDLLAPNKARVSRDLKPYEGEHPPLPPIKIAGVQ